MQVVENRVEIITPIFLYVYAINGEYWSTSRSGRFTPEKMPVSIGKEIGQSRSRAAQDGPVRL
jgi:hypothetical protein